METLHKSWFTKLLLAQRRRLLSTVVEPLFDLAVESSSWCCWCCTKQHQIDIDCSCCNGIGQFNSISSASNTAVHGNVSSPQYGTVLIWPIAVRASQLLALTKVKFRTKSIHFTPAIAPPTHVQPKHDARIFVLSGPGGALRTTSTYLHRRSGWPQQKRHRQLRSQPRIRKGHHLDQPAPVRFAILTCRCSRWPSSDSACL